MTDHRAKLEQQARAWLIARGWCHLDASYQRVVVESDVVTLADLLAAHEADVLEEAAELVETIHPDCNASHMFRMIISNALRAKAQERRG